MYYITGLADTGRTDCETHSVHWKEKPLSGIHYLVTLQLRLSWRTVTYSKTGVRLSWSYEPDFSMHTLSEQLHATNMVRLAKGVWVCVCVLVQGCYWYFGAAVLRLDTEEDVGMQWLCQCSECWCVALQRWCQWICFLFVHISVSGSMSVLWHVTESTVTYAYIKGKIPLHSFALTQIRVLRFRDICLALWSFTLELQCAHNDDIGHDSW